MACCTRGAKGEAALEEKGVFAFEFYDQDMVGVKGYDTEILDALKRHRVRIISKTSNERIPGVYATGWAPKNLDLHA